MIMMIIITSDIHGSAKIIRSPGLLAPWLHCHRVPCITCHVSRVSNHREVEQKHTGWHTACSLQHAACACSTVWLGSCDPSPALCHPHYNIYTFIELSTKLWKVFTIFGYGPYTWCLSMLKAPYSNVDVTFKSLLKGNMLNGRMNPM